MTPTLKVLSYSEDHLTAWEWGGKVEGKVEISPRGTQANTSYDEAKPLIKASGKWRTQYQRQLGRGAGHSGDIMCITG